MALDIAGTTEAENQIRRLKMDLNERDPHSRVMKFQLEFWRVLEETDTETMIYSRKFSRKAIDLMVQRVEPRRLKQVLTAKTQHSDAGTDVSAFFTLLQRWAQIHEALYSHP